MPERDIASLGVMGWGVDAARRFFRRRRRPPKGVIGNHRFPPFSDTYAWALGPPPVRPPGARGQVATQLVIWSR